MIRVIKLKEIIIKKPDFDPHPEKSKTNNHEWRQGLFMIFTDEYGVEYHYMPKWDDVDKLNEMKDKVEMINKELCKINNR